MPKKPSTLGTEARTVPLDVRRLVLHEAGYKCSNPACRYPLTLDVHHLYYVSEGGSNLAENLLPLCPNCHTEHHHGHIPHESLRAWKMLLLAFLLLPSGVSG
jgi:5-methylcytosine-specific restriction endonuclease McrA